MAAENTWGILQQHVMVWPTLRHQHVSRDCAIVLQPKQHLSATGTCRGSNEGPGKRITTMVPLKARHRLCRRTKRTGRRGVEREAGADKVLMMMVSAEHHCADGNQNEAVIGDKLMYGVSDPEPGILIQEQTQTHTRLVELQDSGQRAFFRAQGCTQRGTKCLSLYQCTSWLIHTPPATLTGQSDRHTGPDHQPPVHTISRLLSAL